MQARNAHVLLAGALLALHQPCRTVHAHNQVAGHLYRWQWQRSKAQLNGGQVCGNATFGQLKQELACIQTSQ